MGASAPRPIARKLRGTFREEVLISGEQNRPPPSRTALSPQSRQEKFREEYLIVRRVELGRVCINSNEVRYFHSVEALLFSC